MASSKQTAMAPRLDEDEKEDEEYLFLAFIHIFIRECRRLITCVAEKDFAALPAVVRRVVDKLRTICLRIGVDEKLIRKIIRDLILAVKSNNDAEPSIRLKVSNELESLTKVIKAAASVYLCQNHLTAEMDEETFSKMYPTLTFDVNHVVTSLLPHLVDHEQSQPLLEGYLTKQAMGERTTLPGSLVFNLKNSMGALNWRRRYFVVSPKSLLYYKEKGETKPLKEIAVSTFMRVDEISEVVYKRPYCIKLTLAPRPLIVTAADQDEYNTWLVTLRSLIDEKQTTRRESLMALEMKWSRFSKQELRYFLKLSNDAERKVIDETERRYDKAKEVLYQIIAVKKQLEEHNADLNSSDTIRLTPRLPAGAREAFERARAESEKILRPVSRLEQYMQNATTKSNQVLGELANWDASEFDLTM